VDRDLTYRLGPIEPVLRTIDPILASPIPLAEDEFAQLVAFVRDGLLDRRAGSRSLCGIIPAAVPSGRPMLNFEDCRP
jgi:hypothetical protein